MIQERLEKLRAAMEKNHACMIPNPFGRFKHEHEFCAKMDSFRKIVGVGERWL